MGMLTTMMRLEQLKAEREAEKSSKKQALTTGVDISSTPAEKPEIEAKTTVKRGRKK